MTDEGRADRIDLTETRDMLMAALTKTQTLNGTKLPAAGRGRDRSAALGPIQKDLLFLAHLCDKARVLALDEYHFTRGYTDHLPEQD